MNKALNALIAFVRYPVPGRVKTRLAKDIGPERASLAYRKMAEKVIETLRSGEDAWSLLFFLDDRSFETECRQWLGLEDNLRFQANGSLGDRMADAFAVSFKEGFQSILLVGTDIPSLTTGIIKEAFVKLETNDTVLGRAMDGGYYLIGLKAIPDFIFKDMEWSTSAVFEQTLSRLRAHKISCGLLSEIRDIDTLEDLEHEGLGHYSRP